MVSLNAAPALAWRRQECCGRAVACQLARLGCSRRPVVYKPSSRSPPTPSPRRSASHGLPGAHAAARGVQVRRPRADLVILGAAGAVLLVWQASPGRSRVARHSPAAIVVAAAAAALRPEPAATVRVYSTGAGTGRPSTISRRCSRPAALRLRVRHAAVLVAARALRAGLRARSRSSSAPTCFCGSRTTGSACSSC